MCSIAGLSVFGWRDFPHASGLVEHTRIANLVYWKDKPVAFFMTRAFGGFRLFGDVISSAVLGLAYQSRRASVGLSTAGSSRTHSSWGSRFHWRTYLVVALDTSIAAPGPKKLSVTGLSSLIWAHKVVVAAHVLVLRRETSGIPSVGRPHACRRG